MNSKEVFTECHCLLAHLYVVTWCNSWETIPAACPEVGGGTDAQVTFRQGSESAQSQSDWDSEEPSLMKNVPSCGRRDGLEWSLKVTSSSKQSVILLKSF